MRRVVVLVLTLGLTLFGASPIASASCPTLDGHGLVNFGRTGLGQANVEYDGKRILIGLESTGFDPTGEFTADIFYTLHFPDGSEVDVVEHSIGAPSVGPLVSFTADIDVLSGGTGDLEWMGLSNLAGGIAVIQSFEGTLCLA
jgi:hypothetical protein